MQTSLFLRPVTLGSVLAAATLIYGCSSTVLEQDATDSGTADGMSAPDSRTADGMSAADSQTADGMSAADSQSHVDAQPPDDGALSDSQSTDGMAMDTGGDVSADAAGTFQCGTGSTPPAVCMSGTEFCQIQDTGSGGSPMTCTPVPSQCAGNINCACILPLTNCALGAGAGTCSQGADGSVTVACFG
jgi:hypothetical protein